MIPNRSAIKIWLVTIYIFYQLPQGRRMLRAVWHLRKIAALTAVHVMDGIGKGKINTGQNAPPRGQIRKPVCDGAAAPALRVWRGYPHWRRMASLGKKYCQSSLIGATRTRPVNTHKTVKIPHHHHISSTGGFRPARNRSQ